MRRTGGHIAAVSSLVTMLAMVALAAVPTRATPAPFAWPEGTDTLAFENVEGIILVRAHLMGRPLGAERSEPRPVPLEGADTTGWLALDTGSGFVALDFKVALRLGLIDSLPRTAVDFASRALPRFEIGQLQADQVSPVAVFDAELLTRVTDHRVLGLIGYQVLRDRIVWIDYPSHRLALVPAGVGAELEDASAVAASRRLIGGALSSSAIPTRFRMTPDGKIMLRARVTPNQGGRGTPWMNLVLDTGASKSTLFEDVVAPESHVESWRPVIKGLVAPTLLANSTARLCRVRQIEVQGTSGVASAMQTEIALLRNPIARQLGELAGEPVHGLLGYSFLRRFRVACDYPHRVLWLDPVPNLRDPHPYEHSHVGLQLERDQGRVRIASVVQDSPAARAGIVAGDILIAIDGKVLSTLAWDEIGRLLEGPAGTKIVLTLRHHESVRSYTLRRRQLL